MRMNTPRLIVTAFVSLAAVATPAHAQWLQFGGPDRNFMVQTSGLADAWPEDGPPRLWHRELGDGYSTILVDDGLLYTMYRVDDEEFTIALDAQTGQTVWEHRNPSPYTDLMTQFGPGPHSTPLIVGDRLFSVGTNVVLHCIHKRTGEVLWKHDLVAEFGAYIPAYGYANSPIAYDQLVILPADYPRPEHYTGGLPRQKKKEGVGQEPQSLIAFDQDTGEVAWKKQDFQTDYSSPILINLQDQDQLVLLMHTEIMGVNPVDGELLWHLPVTPVPDENIGMPLWLGDGLLFCSAAYNSGGRVIKLTRDSDRTFAEQLWYSRKLRIQHGNAVHVGDYVYGSSGDFGPCFMVCMNIRTGKRAWLERGFAKATCLYADNKLIILDENGQLGLAKVSPRGMEVLARCTVAERLAWAAPTLVGKTLYVRDRKHIMALDLG